MVFLVLVMRFTQGLAATTEYKLLFIWFTVLLIFFFKLEPDERVILTHSSDTVLQMHPIFIF